MRFASFLDKSLAIALVTAMAAALAWSVFGQPKTPEPKLAEKPRATERHEDLILMDAVRAVNADASTMMLSPFFSLKLSEPISCLLVRKMQERSDATSPALANLIAEKTEECDFAGIVRQVTLPVFLEIAAVGALPKELFVFETFHAEAWVSVGLFDRVNTCNLVQQQRMNQGMGTKVCVKWKPRF
jgi:hypothetical protein